MLEAIVLPGPSCWVTDGHAELLAGQSYDHTWWCRHEEFSRAGSSLSDLTEWSVESGRLSQTAATRVEFFAGGSSGALTCLRELPRQVPAT